MTTPTGPDDLVRKMLERRGHATPPGWLLSNVDQAVRSTRQERPRALRSSWVPQRTSERVVLVAAAAAVLLALLVAALVAGGVIRTSRSPLPATVVEPSPSASGFAVGPDASAGQSGPPAVAGSAKPTHAAAQIPGTVWALPAGSRYEIGCDDDSKCFLTLYGSAGTKQDGWPVALAGNCDGSNVAVGPEESAFVECTADGKAVVTGLDRSGNALPGWPVKLKGPAASSYWNDFTYPEVSRHVAVGPDGTVYAAASPKGEKSYVIHRLARDGHERAGWPVAFAAGLHGFTVERDGVLVAWSYEHPLAEMQFDARRTEFTEMGQDGKVLAGWPRGSTGAASGPVVSDDGMLFYVSASGKIWGHDRHGEIIAGWPYELASPAAPALRADGSLMFIESSRVVVLDGHAKNVGHWPYTTKGSFIAPGCDTGDYSYPLDATARDGTLYLASSDGSRSAIVALRPDGSIVDGWPYAVRDHWQVGELHMTANDLVEAGVGSVDCMTDFSATSITLTTDGRLIGDALPSTLSEVYDSLRLEDLRTVSGKDTFEQGEQIDFNVRLVNRSSRPITLPRVDYDDKSWYAAGAVQTWIEPLVPPISYSGPPIPCLVNPDDQHDNWYATGGAITVSRDPVVIQPGASMPSLTGEVLYPEMTACLPPGRYHYHVVYMPLGSDLSDEAILEETIDFTIAGAPAASFAPTTPPRPTPIPHPTSPTTPAPTDPEPQTTPTPS
ncbi:MAG: hypothetical protein ACJ779_00205 [Chloroflexota bacterium]